MYATLSNDELVKKYQAILASCEGWIKCQDGSYEMALHNAGFDEVWNEMNKRGLI